MIAPITLLGLLLVAAALTSAVDRVRRRHSGRALYDLARASRMNYSPLDRFDLGERLRASTAWTTASTDLAVTDVLYAAHAAERFFIATARSRHTRDERPTAFVVVCVERLDDGVFREVVPRTAFTDPSGVAAYRAALATIGRPPTEMSQARLAASARSSSSDLDVLASSLPAK